MKNYSLIFMSFDGEYVTDSKDSDLDVLLHNWENIGSKWIFYPFSFILSGKKIIETGQGLIRMSDKKAYSELMFKNRLLKTVIKTFARTNELVNDNDLNVVDCYDFEDLLINTNTNLIRN